MVEIQRDPTQQLYDENLVLEVVQIGISASAYARRLSWVCFNDHHKAFPAGGQTSGQDILRTRNNATLTIMITFLMAHLHEPCYCGNLAEDAHGVG